MMFMGFIKKGNKKEEKKEKEIKQAQGISIPSPKESSDESLIVSIDIKEKIETFIFKILYDQKSVKSLKELTEMALEKAAQERITISEKPINLIINQMNKDEKIQFTQKDGWKIRI
ncbi:MAG: hypothetical protein ACFFCV_07895 [Promethearchaeota archaeon]